MLQAQLSVLLISLSVLSCIALNSPIEIQGDIWWLGRRNTYLILRGVGLGESIQDPF